MWHIKTQTLNGANQLTHQCTWTKTTYRYSQLFNLEDNHSAAAIARKASEDSRNDS